MDLFEPSKDIYTVSRLNREVSQLLQGSFPLLWLEGEISNFAAPRSGHLYFSLKDNQAAVRAAMFRNKNMHLPFKPSEGMQVLVRARIGLYEARGDYQLIVEHMEEAGEGALQRAFEQLKKKLSNEGLFDPALKQEIPEMPSRIGIITSTTGAAIRDVLSVLKRRFPLISVLIYPVVVQGDNAANDITTTITLANQRKDCDTLLLVRGGGSLEDLQAFNHESVARAIAAASIPIVSGIGHEVDFTIADFVADVRAATPSAAAELASPNQSEWLEYLSNQTHYLNAILEDQLDDHQQTLESLSRQLQLLHPSKQLQNQYQQIDLLESRLINAYSKYLKRHKTRLVQASHQLSLNSPYYSVLQLQSRHERCCERLRVAIKTVLSLYKQRLAEASGTLDAVSPLATLKRGYAIVSDSKQPLITHYQQVEKGSHLNVQLSEGELTVLVEQTSASQKIGYK